VGLEFHFGPPQVDAAKLAPHLAQLKHLEFIKMPHATAEETARWRQRLPDEYAVLHCPSEAQ
jgi:hypothetical protein